MLDDDVAVDEMGTDPGGVEDRTGLVQEHHTHHVVANVTLLVHLLCEEKEKRERDLYTYNKFDVCV